LKQFESLSLENQTPKTIVAFAEKLYESKEYEKGRYQLGKAIDKLNSTAYEKDAKTPFYKCKVQYLQGLIHLEGYKNE